MPYSSNNDRKNKNIPSINYLNKDFISIKNDLMKYVQAYFPNTYRDFNETSPGMMLLELSAYVGDVLNFYIDQQYREMMLPLSEERRNILTLAKSHGYRVNPISPSYVDLTIKTTVGASSNGNPDFNDSNCCVIDKGMQVVSAADAEVIFETLSVVDFKVSSYKFSIILFLLKKEKIFTKQHKNLLKKF